ncbi:MULTISPECIES: VPLPA-CTERM sorting domain-containing protein [Methylotenera]|uniref:VPLPA-CTERM sorting domain-containing protein n=1 Tax=Methylotenera TaxID=359407 RepID=UPI00035C5AC7|nr:MULTISPECIES: VPLPA-CTERM sorting domain-containing protein [Methylotenera]
MYKKLFSCLFITLSLLPISKVSAATWSSVDPSNAFFGYTVSPADAIWYFDGNITPQSPANIKTVTENQFGLTPGALTFVSGCDSATSNCTNATAGASGNTNTFSSDVAFNYLAVHFGQAELLLYWDNAINSFSITDSQNAFKGLSNYRAYSDGLSEVPLPAAGWLFGTALVGLMGLRRKML